MKKVSGLLLILAAVMACDPGPPPNSFQISFANTVGFDGTKFAIGTAAGVIVCQSGPLAANQTTGSSYVTAGTFSLFIDNGSGWQLNSANLPGAIMDDEYTFAPGKKYEYGTNGGVYMYVIEKP